MGLRFEPADRFATRNPRNPVEGQLIFLSFRLPSLHNTLVHDRRGTDTSPLRCVSRLREMASAHLPP